MSAAERRHANYMTTTGEPFLVVELQPGARDDRNPAVRDAFERRAQQVRNITVAHWTSKFVVRAETNTSMTPEGVKHYVDCGRPFPDRIAQPSRAARYLLATSAVDSFMPYDKGQDPVQALVRVEAYQPDLPTWASRKARFVDAFRLPGRKHYPYPNVTDVCTPDGHARQGSDYGEQARALLYHALDDYEPEHKVSVWTEPDHESLDFYAELGFVFRNTKGHELLPFKLHHLEAPNPRVVQGILHDQLPYLPAPGTV